jgi:hypothetical protein
MTLVTGVAAVNLGFLGVGYAVLARSLRGRSWGERASWAGVALLLGAGAVGTLVFFATIAGLRATLVVGAGAAIGSIGVFVALSHELALPRAPSPPVSTPARAAFAVVGALCLVGLVGGFRSAPWLDDAWGIWLPKGLALWHHGLDERLFVPNGDFVAFGVPDYPLWWSVVTSLDVQAVGEVDVRVMDAQLALLTVALFGAVARLLWGHVRAEVLAAALLLLACCPELWRHVQGGIADLPLAIYVSLSIVATVLWMRTDARFYLFLGAFCAAVALQIKTEALPEVAAVAIVGVALCRDRRLALASLAALATALPWLAWRFVHDVPSRAGELDFGRVDRIPRTLESIFGHLLDPTEWLVVVPLFVALALIARRPRQLLVPGALLAVIVVAYWIDRDEIGFVLRTSAYRVIDPVVLTAAVLVPLLAETFLQQREALREDRRLVGET